MYRLVYGNRKDSTLIQRSVSLDEGFEEAPKVENKPEENVETKHKNDRADEFLRTVFGDQLSNILTQCATAEPEDPILYLADLLEKYEAVETTLFNSIIFVEQLNVRRRDTLL